MASVAKTLQRIIKEAENQGWKVKATKNGYQLLAPDGENIVTVHKTPSDHRALDNVIAEMRRFGFVWGSR